MKNHEAGSTGQTGDRPLCPRGESQYWDSSGHHRLGTQWSVTGLRCIDDPALSARAVLLGTQSSLPVCGRSSLRDGDGGLGAQGGELDCERYRGSSGRVEWEGDIELPDSGETRSEAAERNMHRLTR